ncbi:hypothetical protein [Sphingopyxis sp. PET50]|uniref:hypothetical protein n=1 Tax=Sphingopyxis sp. PET50 TaxID=2976533 RepID=UPI0021AE9E1D|nr:hypothetical protein [Sphingopyxis sp. PET50]
MRQRAQPVADGGAKRARRRCRQQQGQDRHIVDEFGREPENPPRQQGPPEQPRIGDRPDQAGHGAAYRDREDEIEHRCGLPQPDHVGGQARVNGGGGRDAGQIRAVEQQRLGERRPGQQVGGQIGGGARQPAQPAPTLRIAEQEGEHDRIGGPQIGEETERAGIDAEQAGDEDQQEKDERGAAPAAFRRALAAAADSRPVRDLVQLRLPKPGSGKPVPIGSQR